MATLYLEDEDVFNFSGAGVSQPALTAAHIEEAAGEEGIIAQLMDIRHLFFTMFRISKDCYSSPNPHCIFLLFSFFSNVAVLRSEEDKGRKN
jgi:hypothetical protein